MMMAHMPYPPKPKWEIEIGTKTNRVTNWTTFARTPNAVFLPIAAASW
jgi:hypothetical protein